MSCATTLGPGLAGLSAAIQTGTIANSALFAQYCQSCSNRSTDGTLRAAIRAIDNKAMCQVMCCCKTQPQRQNCVRETLDAADALLGGQSRYKAEISYNMRTADGVPTPFMHRVNGQDTTVRSERWQTRAQQEIPGYRSNAGHVRRPDVVIVNDPTRPPTQDNIAQVVEMKFAGDVEQPGQYAAYEDIAGSATRFRVQEEAGCACNGRGDGRPYPIPVPVAAPAPNRGRQPAGNWWEIPAWGVVTVVGAVATVAAVLVPFDGPAGEIAAGAGTAAAAARFAAAWGRVFGPAATAATAGAR